ncbi:MAG: hypothetical protein EOP02_14250 [Proteobacteria bacterium]|nr:MAG: hypothetical protein EOP02_14250 [Pseudomonadota bacterium]
MPQAHLPPAPFEVLVLSSDDLCGRIASRNRSTRQEGDSRMRRRSLAREKLCAVESGWVLQSIDACVERGLLRSEARRRRRTWQRADGLAAHSAEQISSLLRTCAAVRMG